MRRHQVTVSAYAALVNVNVHVHVAKLLRTAPQAKLYEDGDVIVKLRLSLPLSLASTLSFLHYIGVFS